MVHDGQQKDGGWGREKSWTRTRRQRVGEHLVNLGARHICGLVVGISRHAASIAPPDGFGLCGRREKNKKENKGSLKGEGE